MKLSLVTAVTGFPHTPGHMSTTTRALVGRLGCRPKPLARRKGRHIAAVVRRRRGSTARAGRVDDVSQDVQSLSSELCASVSSPTVDDTRVLQLISQLASANAPVTQAAFDGAFEVVWSEGTMAWRALVATFVQRVAGKCRAGQKFNFSSIEGTPNEALNFAELFGDLLTITANGVFRPVESIQDKDNENKIAKGSEHPLGFDVQIFGGGATLRNGKKINLPICGPGAFQVLYSDKNVRIFKSSGGLAVQVPSAWKQVE